MNLGDILSAELFEFLTGVETLVDGILQVVVDTDATAVDLLKQASALLGIQSGTDGYYFACCYGALADVMQSAHHLGVRCRAFLLPFVAAATQGQEGCLSPHDFHRLQAVVDEVEVVVALEQILGKESGHSHRGHLDAQGVGCVAEELLEVLIA